MPSLFDPLAFQHGPAMKNRFMLAPLTNLQSHADGRLSDDEYHWLTLRARGGFGLTMTCASHVQARGQGFPGQLGCWSDAHLDGLRRLAAGIHAAGSLAFVQLHHAGMRSPADLIGTQPVCPSDDAETGARALTLAEVEELREDFVAAAVRADRAGFDGVELHGAHGYILSQFLSPKYNRRDDRYGGSLEQRGRLVFEIVAGIRARCRPDFTLGLRVSPERFGLELGEMREFVQRVLHDGRLDFVDLSLWDAFKLPNEAGIPGPAAARLVHGPGPRRGQRRRGRQDHGRRDGAQVPGARRGLRHHRPRRGAASRLSGAGARQPRLRCDPAAGDGRAPARGGPGPRVHRLHEDLAGIRRGLSSRVAGYSIVQARQYM